MQKATNVFNQQSHVTRDTRGQVEENNQQNFFKVFLFSSESQVSMVAQYGSLASLEQVRIPKFFNLDVIIVHQPGKTTLSFALEEFLVSRGIAAYGLDGDNIRCAAV